MYRSSQGLLRVRAEEAFSRIFGTPPGPQQEHMQEFLRLPEVLPQERLKNLSTEQVKDMFNESFMSYELLSQNRNLKTRIIEGLREYQSKTSVEDRKTIYDQTIRANETTIEFLNTKIREEFSVSYTCYKELQQRGYIPSHSVARCEAFMIDDSNEVHHEITQSLLEIDSMSVVILYFPYVCMVCHMIYRVYPYVPMSLILSFPKMYSYFVKTWKR